MEKYENIQKDNYFPPVKVEETDGGFTIAPLKQGYGMTIAELISNSLNMFSFGYCIVSLKIMKGQDTLDSIPGLREDMDEVLMNFGYLPVVCDGDQPFTGVIPVVKPGVYSSDDITFERDDAKINAHAVPLFHIDDFHENFLICLRCEYGKKSPEKDNCEENVLFTYGRFSPVSRTDYIVSDCLYGLKANYDKVNLEIKTNGTIEKKEALIHAIDNLNEQLSRICDIKSYF